MTQRKERGRGCADRNRDLEREGISEMTYWPASDDLQIHTPLAFCRAPGLQQTLGSPLQGFIIGGLFCWMALPDVTSSYSDSDQPYPEAQDPLQQKRTPASLRAFFSLAFCAFVFTTPLPCSRAPSARRTSKRQVSSLTDSIPSTCLPHTATQQQ